MAIGLPGPTRVIDPVLCWELWAKLGSLGKVRKELIKRGVINTLTGKAPATMSISNSCWRYAAKHPEEIRKKYYEPALLDRGIICTDEIWNRDLCKHMRYIFAHKPRVFDNFMKAHPELEPYRNQPRHGKSPDNPF